MNIKSIVFSWGAGTSVFLLNESILSLLLKVSLSDGVSIKLCITLKKRIA